MYQEQRFERILMLLEERGNLSVKEMVDELRSSKDTVRRDFYCLSQKESGSTYPWRYSSS